MPVIPQGATESERRSILFDALSSLDLSSLVEKRDNLSYLSWANCLAVLKQVYPDASYRVIKNPQNGLPYFLDPEIGIIVFTEVTIEGMTTECFLPVMDNRNRTMLLQPYTYTVYDKYKKQNVEKSVEAATMFDVNKTIWRCLVKNVAIATGIGLYIYQGEDVPEKSNNEPDIEQSPVQRKKTGDKFSGIRTAINDSPDISSLRALYLDHQNEIEGNPEIKALLTQRKQQILLLNRK